jgi:hypothetical protein
VKRPNFTTAQWRKPTGSGDSGCVEIAYADGWIGVRDTKDAGAGLVLAFTEHEWQAFLAGVSAGEFGIDRLTS